jgi:(1->4)-alpha-D-glucan 1-alpha-D-glucosylmutase
MTDAAPKPIATYRVQFNPEFRLADAQPLAQYFGRLGVTHVYASPVLRARTGSTHGYDVVDCSTINPQLGDWTDLRALTTALHAYGMALLLDIVPNHMAASLENPYWRDVLTYGSASPYARWFDIDWRLPDRAMWGRVLVPILGEPRRRVLEEDQIQLTWSDGRFLVAYFDHRLPIDPATLPMVGQFGLAALRDQLGGDRSLVDPLIEILKHLRTLPKIATRQRRRVNVDRDDTEQWLGRFAQLALRSPRFEQWVEHTAAKFGEGIEGRKRLEKLLDAQPYRLVHWRDAARTINYRRFFDINELISIRQEDPQVFEETHAAVLRWIADGTIDGLRIDHVDGLRDPLGYLNRLSEKCRATGRLVPIFVEKILARDEELPRSWPVEGTTGYEFLNEVEAIFVVPEGFNQIREHYRKALRKPISFTKMAASGKRRVLRHDLSPHVGRLADILGRLYQSTRKALPVGAEEVAAGTDRQSADVAESSATAAIAAETNGAAQSALAAPPWERHELSNHELVDAIVEVVVALPVYRTYVDSRHRTVSEADRRVMETAIAGARKTGRASSETIDFLAHVLLLEGRADLSPRDLDERVTFIQRFQQLTGPAAAKGIEDTALYAFVPFIALNEVGGEPRLPKESAVEFLHKANAARAATWPRSMLCATTHDTKRTADVRARLDVLSELPTLWTGLVTRWQRLNKDYRTLLGNVRAPDAAAEILCYQTIVGIWPVPDANSPATLPDEATLKQLSARVEAYMLKAAREAKAYTSWTNVDAEYEHALVEFVRGILAARNGVSASSSNAFLADVQRLVARISRPGFWNSLSRTLIQFTSPGTPDLYQGDELWNFALVDPDNRRPVDYASRQTLLQNVVSGFEADANARAAFIHEIVSAPEDGRVKLHAIRAALVARREFPELFAQGTYEPLEVTGERRDHVVAFARRGQHAVNGDTAEAAALVVVPRFTAALAGDGAGAPLGDVWSDTAVLLPAELRNRRWRSMLTGEQLSASETDSRRVANLLTTFPAALLVAR